MLTIHNNKSFNPQIVKLQIPILHIAGVNNFIFFFIRNSEDPTLLVGWMIDLIFTI